MEEIAGSTSEEQKRHHLELERQSLNSIPTAPRMSAYPDAYVPNGQFFSYNPQPYVSVFLSLSFFSVQTRRVTELF